MLIMFEFSYFNKGLIKLFSDLNLLKFLDISTKLFFPILRQNCSFLDKDKIFDKRELFLKRVKFVVQKQESDYEILHIQIIKNIAKKIRNFDKASTTVGYPLSASHAESNIIHIIFFVSRVTLRNVHRIDSTYVHQRKTE